MRKPAATLQCMHQCPMFEGLKPHVGGPVITAKASVLINGQPAASVSDKLQCNGPVDEILTGSISVKIGGKYAARKDDKTQHGGIITTGSLNVLIG